MAGIKRICNGILIIMVFLTVKGRKCHDRVYLFCYQGIGQGIIFGSKIRIQVKYVVSVISRLCRAMTYESTA
jgi:hypothetical protein